MAIDINFPWLRSYQCILILSSATGFCFSGVFFFGFSIGLNACENSFASVLDQKITITEKIVQFEKFGGACGMHGRYYFLLADLYSEAGKKEDALRVLERGSRTTVDYSQYLRFAIAGVHYSRGDLQTAADMAENLVSEFPYFSGGYALLADISLLKKYFKNAIHYAKKNSAINPSAGAYSVLIAAYYETDMLQQALDAFEEGMRLENAHLIIRSDSIIAAAYAAAQLGRLEKSSRISSVRLNRPPVLRNRELERDLEVKMVVSI